MTRGVNRKECKKKTDQKLIANELRKKERLTRQRERKNKFVFQYSSTGSVCVLFLCFVKWKTKTNHQLSFQHRRRPECVFLTREREKWKYKLEGLFLLLLRSESVTTNQWKMMKNVNTKLDKIRLPSRRDTCQEENEMENNCNRRMQ